MKDESIFLVLFFGTVIASWLILPEAPSAPARWSAASGEDRCHDPRLEAEWRQVLDRAPDDPALLEGRALRMGLCQMLEQGEISPQQVAEIWGRQSSERSVSFGSF